MLGVWVRMPAVFQATRALGTCLLLRNLANVLWRRRLARLSRPSHLVGLTRWREPMMTGTLTLLTLFLGYQGCGASLEFLNIDRSGTVFAAALFAAHPLAAVARHAIVLMVASHVGAHLLAWAAWQARLP